MTLLTWLMIGGAVAAGNLATYLAIMSGKAAFWHFRMWYLNKKYPMPPKWPADRPLA